MKKTYGYDKMALMSSDLIKGLVESNENTKNVPLTEKNEYKLRKQALTDLWETDLDIPDQEDTKEEEEEEEEEEEVEETH